MNDDPYLTPAQVRELLAAEGINVCRVTVNRWMRRPGFPVTELPGLRRKFVRRSALLRWLQSENK